LGIELGYHVVGKVTSLLTSLKSGDKVELWGPLGNGFPDFKAKHLVCVGGGIGYTPFFAVCREALGLRNYGDTSRKVHAEEVTFLYGTRDQGHAAPLSEVEQLGVKTMISTDDGSLGHHGLVTELLERVINSANPPDKVLCCGPERMMEAVGRICLGKNIPCWLSLESPMACGFGACFSCVAKIKQPDGTWDYRRTCVEGPVFTAEQLVF
jgi:dihydroorotate dehydrogenase electron transfer subunit